MELDTRIGESLRTDYFLLREEFTTTQLDYLTRARTFVEQEVLPVINGYWERVQFGKPLVSFQLIQDRLVKMLAKVTAMQPYCRRLADLAMAGRNEPNLAGLAKSHNTSTARQVLAEARDMLGGNGILLDFHVTRHMADIEAIHTFEGTETIQNLIVGRDITGVSAFV